MSRERLPGIPINNLEDFKEKILGWGRSTMNKMKLTDEEILNESYPHKRMPMHIKVFADRIADAQLAKCLSPPNSEELREKIECNLELFIRAYDAHLDELKINKEELILHLDEFLDKCLSLIQEEK